MPVRGKLHGKAYPEAVSSLSTEVVESSTVAAEEMVLFLRILLGAGRGFAVAGLLERKTRLGVSSGNAGMASWRVRIRPFCYTR